MELICWFVIQYDFVITTFPISEPIQVTRIEDGGNILFSNVLFQY